MWPTGCTYAEEGREEKCAHPSRHRRRNRRSERLLRANVVSRCRRRARFFSPRGAFRSSKSLFRKRSSNSLIAPPSTSLRLGFGTSTDTGRVKPSRDQNDAGERSVGAWTTAGRRRIRAFAANRDHILSSPIIPTRLGHSDENNNNS